MMGFSMAPGSYGSPSDVERRRKLAEALTTQGTESGPVYGPWGAAARVAAALAGSYQDSKASKMEAEGRKSAASTIAAAMSGQPVDYSTAANNAWIDPAQLMQLQNSQADIAWDKESRAHDKGTWANSDAMDAAKLKAAQEELSWGGEQRAHQRGVWDQAEQQRKAVLDMIPTLPEDQQAIARAYPEEFAKEYLQKQYDTSGGGSGGYFGTPLPFQDGEGKYGYGLAGKDGSSIALPAPGGGSWLDPMEKSRMQSMGTQRGKEQGKAAAEIPGAEVQVNYANTIVDKLLNDPNLEGAMGWNSYRPDFLSSNEIINTRSYLRELGGQAFVQARNVLKGGGQITDFESKRAEAAYSRIETAVRSSDPKALREALIDFREAMQAGIDKLRAVSSGDATQGGGNGGWTIEEAQ